MSVSGAQSFSVAGGRDVFADLDTLETALRADDAAAVRSTLGDLEASREQLVTGQARAGLILRRLDTSSSVLEQSNLDLKQQQSSIGDADTFKTFSELTQLGQTLQNSIAVSQRLLSLDAFERF